MRIRNPRLTGAHYFRQRLLGGKDLYVEESYTEIDDRRYGSLSITRKRWRRATNADWLKLKARICE